MSRFSFGGGAADFAVRVVGASVTVPVSPAAVSMWTAQTGGTQITDLLNASGAAVTTITSNTDGSIPVFSGPNDGSTVLWADGGGSERVRLIPYGAYERVFAPGTLAARPSAATYGLGFYGVTDDNTLWHSDGTAWSQWSIGNVAGGIEQFYTELSASFSTASTSAVDVNSFTGTIGVTPAKPYYVDLMAHAYNDTGLDGAQVTLWEQIDGGSWTAIGNAVAFQNSAGGRYASHVVRRRRNPGSGHIAAYKVSINSVVGGTTFIKGDTTTPILSVLSAVTVG